MLNAMSWAIMFIANCLFLLLLIILQLVHIT